MANSTVNPIGYGPRRHYFDGDERNYEIWLVKFKSFLRTRGLHRVLTDSQIDEDQNAAVFAELIQILDDRSINLIMRDAEDDGKKAMEILNAHYKSNGKPRIISLYTEITTLTKHTIECVTDYIIRAEKLASALREAGEVISDDLLIAMTMKGLPKEFQPICVVMSQRQKLSFMEFKTTIRNFEDTEKLTRNPEDTKDTIMETKHSQKPEQKNYSNPRWCTKCKTHTHDTRYCKRFCSIHKTDTHWTKDCLQRNKNTAKTVRSKEDQDWVFGIASEKTNGAESYLVDSGATTHILKSKDNFIRLNNDFKTKHHVVELANGEKAKGIVEGKGDAIIDIKDAKGKYQKIILKDTLYIPSFGQNILSVTAATNNGAAFNFQKDSAHMNFHNRNFRINQRKNLYYLNSVRNTAKTLQEWHEILGHCNKNDILKLQNVVKGMCISSTENFSCETCILAKMTDNRNRESDTRSTKPLNKIHLDLAGPISPTASDGFRYAFICVDDFSSITCLYLLKNKSDTARAFSKFLAEIAPYGKVKCIRSDGGGEFTSREFTSILETNKIKHEKSAPASPHQNGRAERQWRTIFEMARCLLVDSKLPKSLWTYAVHAAGHIRNRCFNNRLGKTPYEAVTGIKPDISRLHKFGQTCYALKQNPKKLENRSEKGIFLGYDKGSPAYLIYFPDTEKIQKVRVVNFSEIPPEVVPEEEEELNHDKNTEITTKNESESKNEYFTSQRTRQKPKYLEEYILDEDMDDQLNTTTHYCYNIDFDVPKSFAEAKSSKEAHEWNSAMEREIEALTENDTYEIVPYPKDRNVIGSRWVYTIKSNQNGEQHYKARFVAKGYSQIEGIDYYETFSPTARMSTIRIMCQIAVQNNLDIHQMDVKAAYLNAPIHHDIYVEPPKGFILPNDKENKLAWKLKKSLYGLKQSGRNWNHTLDEFLISLGFVKSINDPCFYSIRDRNIYLIHWVDDILIASNSQNLNDIKRKLENRFKMKDLDQVSYFLGIEFNIENNVLTMHQGKYIAKILEKFQMEDCKPRSTPGEKNPQYMGNCEPLDEEDLKTYRKIVGSLIYVMTATRPDICYTVTKLSQHMSNAQQCHITMAKHALRFLKGSIDKRLTFRKSCEPLEVIGYSDSDWANCTEDRKSITGYVFKLAAEGPLISWKTRKQPTIALSSCEAEYMATCSATQEGVYLTSLMNEVFKTNQTNFILFCDNQGTISLANNPVKHQRSKHIDIKYHYIRNEISKGRLTLRYIETNKNIADAFTKPVTAIKLRKFEHDIMG
ncbi:hypothetical protein Ahia01_001231700 [Argonauta hians]